MPRRGLEPSGFRGSDRIDNNPNNDNSLADVVGNNDPSEGEAALSASGAAAGAGGVGQHAHADHHPREHLPTEENT
eukprot:CAMPEP_0172313356 /NCGR_PEP_ID=MMETSP1058-20130122/20132_1 /TAXON_ID=83371 /ORGANISM="Detonula confervacea, Strain CCMP 353" /LENGTH=75 /DNA_ID=CAMNT_0013027001 /DNA_START=304 /DNA_END=528 /DNA_ORIENTATION=+